MFFALNEEDSFYYDIFPHVPLNGKYYLEEIRCFSNDFVARDSRPSLVAALYR